MDNKKPELAQCPVGVNDCEWLQDIAKLKQDVEELKLLATVDPLTGLYNFRHFQTTLDIEMQRTVRTSRPTSLILIDLDHFKAVNDKWGHEGGNVALQTVADIFRHQLRQFDIVCRYGGEEFAVILPHTPLPIAVKVAERIRRSLELAEVNVEQGRFHLTASFGVNVFMEKTEYSQELLVKSADQYLYQAKDQGRNQVCHPDLSTFAPETAVTTGERSELLQKSGQD